MINFDQLQVLFLVFARTTAFAATAPFFSIRNAPALVKVGLGALLALLIFPAAQSTTLPSTLLGFSLEAAGEVLVGLGLGFTATLWLTAVKMAGELGDLQVGFAMTGLVDVLSGSRTSLIGEYFYLLGVLLFLIINGHHNLIMSLARSYQLVPVGAGSINEAVTDHIVRVFTGMFALAFRIALPILVVLFITDLALGLVARTVPQLNVFILGFPIKVALGIILIGVLSSLLVEVVQNIASLMERDMSILMRSWR